MSDDLNYDKQIFVLIPRVIFHARFYCTSLLIINAASNNLLVFYSVTFEIIRDFILQYFFFNFYFIIKRSDFFTLYLIEIINILGFYLLIKLFIFNCVDLKNF